MFGGILLETCIFIFLLYCPGVNKVFGGRYFYFHLGRFLSSCWESQA